MPLISWFKHIYFTTIGEQLYYYTSLLMGVTANLITSSYFLHETIIVVRKIRGLHQNLAIIFLARNIPREYMIRREDIFAQGFGMMTSSNENIFRVKNWPFVRGIPRSPMNSPHKGQWRGTLMFSLIWFLIKGWVNNREAGDLRRYRAHYDVIVMVWNIVRNIPREEYSLQDIGLNPRIFLTRKLISTYRTIVLWFFFMRTYVGRIS